MKNITEPCRSGLAMDNEAEISKIMVCKNFMTAAISIQVHARPLPQK